jgi:hypothetical protein
MVGGWERAHRTRIGAHTTMVGNAYASSDRTTRRVSSGRSQLSERHDNAVPGRGLQSQCRSDCLRLPYREHERADPGGAQTGSPRDEYACACGRVSVVPGKPHPRPLRGANIGFADIHPSPLRCRGVGGGALLRRAARREEPPRLRAPKHSRRQTERHWEFSPRPNAES